jgi:hypothetical protein
LMIIFQREKEDKKRVNVEREKKKDKKYGD